MTYGQRETDGRYCPVCGRLTRRHLPSGKLYRHQGLEDDGESCPASGETIRDAQAIARRQKITRGETQWTSAALGGLFPPGLGHYALDAVNRPSVVSSPQVTESKENVVSIERLRQDVKKTGDDSSIGDVIRWNRRGRHIEPYTFAALRTRVGWTVTGNSGWGLAGKTVTYAELVVELGRDDVSDIAVATTWTDI